MSICILLMVLTGFICAFFPQKELFGFWPSYLVFTLSRFILACSTRGISVTGFVLSRYHFVSLIKSNFLIVSH